MDLRLKNPAFWASLHLQSGLQDWDMPGELALFTTCDQLPPGEAACLLEPPRPLTRASPRLSEGGPGLAWPGVASSPAVSLDEPPSRKGEGKHGASRCSDARSPASSTASLPTVAEKALPAVQFDQAADGPAKDPRLSSLGACETDLQPHLWMWVDPNLVCPIPGHVAGRLPTPGLCPLAAPEAPSFSPAHFGEDPCDLPEGQGREEDPENALGAKPTLLWKEHSRSPPQACQNVKGFRSRSGKLKRAQGGWSRPPLSYCMLISLALSSSVDSSLTAQEIYKFTRDHFPFFRTAPEGWKNTVRHNLCFSSSFEKTTDFVCLEGNRKSRLWKLTMEGQRKFQEEAQALPEDTLGLVYQSMDKPELMTSLFGL